jgi:hypothetical protein
LLLDFAAGAAELEVEALPPPDAADLFTPPCPLQAPRPLWVEVVPSLQVTVAAPPELDEPEALELELAAGAALAPLDPLELLELLLPLEPLAAAAVAFLSIPPWPLQAPRPPCGDVVPSLQVTGLLAVLLLLSCARLNPGAVSHAAVSSAPPSKPLSFMEFIDVSPHIGRYCRISQNTAIGNKGRHNLSLRRGHASV